MIRPRHTTDLPEKLTVPERIGASTLMFVAICVTFGLMISIVKAAGDVIRWLEALS